MRHRLAAEAEFALVGHAPPHERQPEGPFGDHYGYYSLHHDYPVFHVDAVFHRRDAIYPATVVGKPRQEDFFIGDYLQTTAVAAVSAGDAVCARSLDLWRDWISFAVRGGSAGALWTRGACFGFPHSR